MLTLTWRHFWICCLITTKSIHQHPWEPRDSQSCRSDLKREYRLLTLWHLPIYNCPSTAWIILFEAMPQLCYDWEILLHAYSMCSQDAQENITAGYVQEYTIENFASGSRYQATVLSEALCLLVSIVNACCLLPILNCLYPIFTFVLVPC